MTYEIPQSIQYKEKIVFDLTLELLIYAVGFGVPAFLIYAKLNASLYARVGLALIPLTIGLCFMFLDLYKKSSELLGFLRFRKATLFQRKMKRFLQLNAVENSCYVVKTKGGERRVAVLRVEPLNFKIKTKDERDSIIFAFQKLLNGLDFPVQFLMYTDDLNLNQYLKELELKSNASTKGIRQDLLKAHKDYLDALMQDKLAVNRKFLIAIPENETGLEAQIKIVTELLRTMNLKSVRLGGRQLINILIKLFNNPRGRAELLKVEKNIYTIVAPEEVVNSPDQD